MRRPWVAALVVLAAGIGAGAVFLARASRATASPDQPTRLFEQVFGHIQRFGVDSLPTSELYRRASDGLLRQLDDEYAMLLPEGAGPADAADAGGLGLLLSTRDGRVVVLGVLPDSPAERAGIARGDQLFEVGGQPMDASRRDLLLAALTGPVGGTVRLVRSSARPWRSSPVWGMSGSR
jgi:carboxyl-terminal processing protease